MADEVVEPYIRDTDMPEGAQAYNIGIEEFDFNKERYWQSAFWLGEVQAGAADTELQMARGLAAEAKNVAYMQSDMYQRESADYKQRADIASQTMQEYYDNFLGGFQTMLGENTSAMQDFNQTYGNIMDNVKQGIMDVSSAQLSATGREQLSLDMETLGKTFDNSMASRGMARSGMSVEADRRMAMDAAQQGRAIDVNANQQAIQLQGQGLQNLNSMYGIQSGIQDQRMEILGQQGQANQAVGNTYGNLASQFYGASSNMFGQGFGAVNQSLVNEANIYQSTGQSRLNAVNSFYAGVPLPSANSVMTGLQMQADQSSDGTDWGGIAQGAGALAGAFSDVRLKNNIQKVGKINGINMHTWE